VCASTPAGAHVHVHVHSGVFGYRGRAEVDLHTPLLYTNSITPTIKGKKHMSGGHFHYRQYEIEQIADAVEQLILTNFSAETDQWGSTIGHNLKPNTIAEFRRGLALLRQAGVYAQRIDWLISGDDGEDSFHTRLADDLRRIRPPTEHTP